MTEVPEEVAEPVVVSAAPASIRNRKKKKSGCECDESQQREQFVLPASKGLIRGNFCTVCYAIIDWNLDVPEAVAKAPKLELKEKKVVDKVGKVAKPAEKIIQAYEILQLMPIEVSPDKIRLICGEKNAPFSVDMQSTIEKVQAGLSNPAQIIGKYVELEFELASMSGVPLNPIVKSFKNKP